MYDTTRPLHRPLHRLLGIGAVAVICPLAAAATSGTSEHLAAAGAVVPSAADHAGPLLAQDYGPHDRGDDTSAKVHGGQGATAVNVAGAGGYAAQTANQDRTDNSTHSRTHVKSTTVDDRVSNSHNSRRDRYDDPPYLPR